MILLRQETQTVWEQGSSLGQRSAPSYPPGEISLEINTLQLTLTETGAAGEEGLIEVLVVD